MEVGVVSFVKRLADGSPLQLRERERGAVMFGGFFWCGLSLLLARNICHTVAAVKSLVMTAEALCCDRWGVPTHRLPDPFR
jgi:hypothetical protein